MSIHGRWQETKAPPGQVAKGSHGREGQINVCKQSPPGHPQQGQAWTLGELCVGARSTGAWQELFAAGGTARSWSSESQEWWIFTPLKSICGLNIHFSSYWSNNEDLQQVMYQLSQNDENTSIPGHPGSLWNTDCC